MSTKPSRLTVHLRLARASNLPTVATNVLLGAVLGGGQITLGTFLPAGVAMCALYIGGMYLNDAFDCAIDSVERPERPIPAGHIKLVDVFGIGFGLLGSALAILLGSAIFGGARFASVGTGFLLACAIVLYDAWHKKNPLSPLLMGACRVLVYLTAALATGGTLNGTVWAGAAVLLGYLIGLTYVAKQENLARFTSAWPLAFLAAPVLYAPLRGLVTWPVAILMGILGTWVGNAVLLLRSKRKGIIPRAVGSLIAGISLVDALLAAAHGDLATAITCALMLPVTLLFHRFVAGT